MEPYLVHVYGKGEPKRIQWGEETARGEAKRLAKENPNRSVCVYKLVAQYNGVVEVSEFPLPKYEEQVF